MNSKYLEYFLRVAETGSINKAAVELKISQPSLSRNISLLEHEMGSELFVRSRNGVSLTEPGKLLFEQARPLLRQFSILREQIGDMARGQVAVGIPPSWRAVLTVDFSQAILADNDQIEVRVNENVSHVIRAQLDAGVVDLCIAPSESAASGTIRQTPIVEEPLVLVGSAAAGLSPKKPVPVSALSGLPIITPPRPNAIRKMIEQELAIHQTDFNVAIEVDTLGLSLAMAARDLGYSITPRCALLSNPQFTDVTWAPISNLFLQWSLFENLKRTHSQAVRKCRRLIFDLTAKSAASKRWGGAQSLQRSKQLA
ncbi:MAG: LysR family transcriptional regulator [Pseudomonadota bacterium]